MKRIFVAVDISDQARRRAAAYIEALRAEFRHLRVGWEKPGKLHLTLKFLGDADPQQLDGLTEIVAKIAASSPKFKIRLAHPGVFPNPRNPRVLWIDVTDEAGNLAQINGRLETEGAKIGFDKERRSFVPHLTIGRIREPNRSSELARRHLENDFEPVAFEVRELVIYESRLLPAGSVYSVVSRHALKGEI